MFVARPILTACEIAALIRSARTHDSRISASIPSWSGYGLARSAQVFLQGKLVSQQVSQLDHYLSSSWPVCSGMVSRP